MNATLSKSQIYDTINCKLTATVYHERSWLQGSNKRNATFHSLKFMNESADYSEESSYQIELGRLVRVIEKKVTGDFRENPIKTIIVYQNLNNGGTNRANQNPMVMKIVVNNNSIVRYDCFIDEQYWRDFMESIKVQIQERLQGIN